MSLRCCLFCSKDCCQSLNSIAFAAVSAFFSWARTYCLNMVLFFIFVARNIDISVVTISNTGSATSSFAFLLAALFPLGG